MAAAKSSRRTPPPDVRINFLLADDIRFEEQGKVTAIGLYPDKVVVAYPEEGSPEPSDDTPLVLPVMHFMFSVGGLKGNHKISFEFNGLKNKATLDPQTVTFPSAEKSVSLAGRLRPLVSASYGLKEVVLCIGDQRYSGTFELRRGIGPYVSPKAKTVAPSKKVIRSAKRG